MNTVKTNINNLTNLWAMAGKPFTGFATDNVISYSLINHSEWPNKIWSNQDLTIEIVKSIRDFIQHSDLKIRFATFEHSDTNHDDLIEDFGFKLTSALPGMSLKLSQSFPQPTRLEFTMVTSETEAKIWSQTFKNSFGYLISKDTVLKTMPSIKYYLAFDNKEPVGTIILHQTNRVAGIHSLGVPTNSRGKGYAKEIMHYILNEAMRSDAEYATLQASKMAKGMYEQLGFTVDFTMKNYELKN
ncbi:GNAT family N-acetyltransferase [Gaetbulibacter sp. M235]|uniref:GNAT family N-acetyltransferase n=1 Tax=Gaetbulibacter sp. M235 TaxID=3126510 RepID=UPI00374EDB8A